MRATRDVKKAIRTAKVALAAGKFDTARRAVAYAMSATAQHGDALVDVIPSRREVRS